MNTAVAIAGILVGGAVKLAAITGLTILIRAAIPQWRMQAPQKDTAPKAKAEPAAEADQQLRPAA